MRTPFGSIRNTRGFVAPYFLSSLLAAIFLPLTAATAGEENSTGTPAGPEAPPPSRGVSASAPQWTVSIEGIVLGRAGGVNQTLVARVPGGVPFTATSIFPGAEAFNSNQFQRGFSAGPKLGLIYHGASGYGVELSYFNIFDQSAIKAIGPDSPADWLVMKAPGIFWQTQDFPNRGVPPPVFIAPRPTGAWTSPAA